MIFKHKHKLPAITFIETLVYLGIFGLLFTSVMQFVFFFGQSNKRAEIKQDLESVLIFNNVHLNNTFLKSVSIDSANSVFNNNNGKLRSLNSSGQYYEYSVLNNRINFNNNGVSNYITNPEIIVDQFLAEQVLSSSNTVVGVRITVEFYNKIETGIKKSFTTMYTFK